MSDIRSGPARRYWLVPILLAAAPVAAMQGGAPAARGAAAAPVEQVRDVRLDDGRVDDGRANDGRVNGGSRARSGDIAQITAPARQIVPPDQLTADRRHGDTAAHSPIIAASLSRPADGRRPNAVPIGGRDRCDPQAGTAAPALCATAIETRADQFRRPNPLRLSPEERLLVDQPGQASGVLAESVRQRADQGADADAADVQGLASVVLQRPPAPDIGIDAATLSPDSLAVIQAVVEGLAPPQGGR